jgi:hypothetical protein
MRRGRPFGARDVARALRVAVAIALVAASGVACGLAPPAPASIRVSAESFPWANLSHYRTYRWWKPPPERGLSEREALIDWYVRNAVDRELAARGWVPDVRGTPDFVVRYEVSLADGSTSSFQDYLQYRSEGGSKDMGEAFMGYEVGTLTITLVDVESRRPAWRGHASAIVEQDARGKRIDPAVHEMFARLPGTTRATP